MTAASTGSTVCAESTAQAVADVTARRAVAGEWHGTSMYDRCDRYDRSQERTDAVIFFGSLELEKMTSARRFLGPVVPVAPVVPDV